MNIKRLLPFTLAVTILASAVVSCGDTDTTATPDNQPTDNTAAVTEAVTDDPKLAAKTSYFDSLPAFSGTTKEIRFAGDTGDIAVEAEDGEKLNDAIYRRNIEIEDRFGISIVHTEYDDRNALNSDIRNSVNAGDAVIDVISAFTNDIEPLFTAGYLVNLKNLPNINWEEPWWDVENNKRISVGGFQFCAISELCQYANNVMAMLVMNKELAANYDMEVPYQMVRDGKWTYDALYEIAKQVPLDSNGDGKMDVNDDIVAVTGEANNLIGIILSCGIDYFVKDADDYPVFVLNSEENANRFEKIFNIFTDFQRMLTVDIVPGLKDVWGTWNTKFRSGNSLFMMDYPVNFSYYLDFETDYGVLPMPKYDEAQENYRTMTHTRFTSAVCVPKVHAASDADIGLILDVMSYLSYVDVVPTFTETYLENRYIRDEESAEMLRIAMGSKYIDLSTVVLQTSLGSVGSIPLGVIKKGTNTFVSDVEKKEKSILKSIEKLHNTVAEVSE